VSEDEAAAVNGNALLGAWPNPSTGLFSVSSVVPQGTTGTVDIFDITGRSVEHFDAGSVQSVSIEDSGVYFVRLTTGAGEVVMRQVAVIR
jgi:hypothetical protein